jgi:serine/threonine-protein kinase RsbW
VLGGTGQPHLRPVVELPHPDQRESAVELSIPARPENVAVIRRVLSAFGESLRLDPALVDDMRLAVTEACTNVVRHAYPGDEDGTIDLTVTPTDDALYVVVGDHGRGIGPSPDTRGPGLGLPLIAAIVESLEIEQAPGAGSRVAMSFARRRREAAA